MPKRDQQSKQAVNDSGAGEKSTAFTVDEARDAILSLISSTTKTDSISITNASGRTIVNDVYATSAIPPFKNSAMDGYAVRHQDTTDDQVFKIIGKSLAGHPFNGKLGKGEAVRITTGAAIPEGADAIVIQELVTVTDDTFTTNASIKAHQYIRNPGDDIESGQHLVGANTTLTAADIGLLAAQGISHIDVFALPRVGIFSTGDELQNPAATLHHGEIYDSNRATIQTILTNAGVESTDLGICKDDKQSLEELFKSADGLDFVLSSGGVSVGEADHIKANHWFRAN